MPAEAPATFTEAAQKAALGIATVAVSDLAREARRDRSIAWRWGTGAFCFLLLCILTYLLVRDARDGHAMTKEEYETANKARDEALAKDNAMRDDKLAGVRADFREMTARLTAALEGVVSLRSAQDGLTRDVKDGEARLRFEIQGTNARVDRVLEAISKPK